MIRKLNNSFIFIVTIISLIFIDQFAGCNLPPQHYQSINSPIARHQHTLNRYNNNRQIHTTNPQIVNQHIQTRSKLRQHYLAAVPQTNNRNYNQSQNYRYENYPQNTNSASNGITNIVNSNVPSFKNSTNVIQASYADVNPSFISQMSGNNSTGTDNSTNTAANSTNTSNNSNLSNSYNETEISTRNPNLNQQEISAYQEPTYPTSSKTPPPKTNIDKLLKSPLTGIISNRKSNYSTITKTNNLTNINNLTNAKPGIRQEFIREITPLNNRQWSPNHSVLQTAEINDNLVTIRNVRYSKYNSPHDYQPRYYNATFDLNQIRTIDLIIVPIKGLPSVAHVESSFGFADGKHILMSITARYEEGEIFDPIASALRQFELIYVFADERDILQLDSQINKNEVYLYRLNFNPNEVRVMFVDALRRANKLAEKPEFYHPIRNSCVTNLVDHINKGRPKAIPANYKTLLPGMIGKYVFDLKLVDTAETDFKVVKENAKINWLVERFGDLEYFSAGIRNKTY
ncbi:MAG: DUF4105 domain-containing protein [Planctomycetaceae bacterium]|jgi:hypothetical protein|nr:DUF4105 domain-containing protein [Planctomycetaceae bacterium]